MIEILAPGPLTTVQDRGRRGYAHLGVGRSGAADAPALALANELVGNSTDAAGLEITFGGLRARFAEPVTIALTGAVCAGELGGAAVVFGRAVDVAAGASLRLRAPAAGLRSYLAVRGGIAVPPVLGSRSTDLLSGLGPPVVSRGDVLPVGGDPVRARITTAAPPPRVRGEILVFPGPRDDWFEPGALAALCAAPYTVTPESNRIGLRLRGPVLARRDARELPPEGMACGALQVPPNGQPVLFLADHPVTGGYPVIGVVDAAGVCAAAQARPGEELRFAVRAF